MKQIIISVIFFVVGIGVGNFIWNPRTASLFDEQPTMRIYAPNGYEIQDGYRDHWYDSLGHLHCGVAGKTREDWWHTKESLSYGFYENGPNMLDSNYSELLALYFRKKPTK